MKCPICKTPVSESPPPPGVKSYFPFCSERCKLIDLGRWLGGKYQIPVKPGEEDESADESTEYDRRRSRLPEND